MFGFFQVPSIEESTKTQLIKKFLPTAFTQMGFRFTPEFINFLVKKSDPQTHKEVSVDQFIVLCVQVQRFTEAFRQRDTQQNGTITIGFEDFLTVAIGCSYWGIANTSRQLLQDPHSRTDHSHQRNRGTNSAIAAFSYQILLRCLLAL